MDYDRVGSTSGALGLLPLHSKLSNFLTTLTNKSRDHAAGAGEEEFCSGTRLFLRRSPVWVQRFPPCGIALHVLWLQSTLGSSSTRRGSAGGSLDADELLLCDRKVSGAVALVTDLSARTFAERR